MQARPETATGSNVSLASIMNLGLRTDPHVVCPVKNRVTQTVSKENRRP